MHGDDRISTGAARVADVSRRQPRCCGARRRRRVPRNNGRSVRRRENGAAAIAGAADALSVFDFERSSIASAVAIGRPFLWGLGAFGPAGVDRVSKSCRPSRSS
jgi:hypothetical protein